jgi:hypothetical protein
MADVTSQNPAWRWAVIQESVRGASHLRSGLPNQDAITYRAGTDGEPPIVLAVSDGHGSPKTFRSDIGARLAVETAADTVLKFLSAMGSSPASVIKAAAERLLATEILRDWRRAVSEHLLANPFSAAELDQLEQTAGVSAREAVQKELPHFLAYGATLLVVGVGADFMIFLQIGDGDMLVVRDDVREVQSPIDPDPALMANETTSLCMASAHKRFRSRFQFLQGSAPALIIASTDGYSNSFATQDDFQRVGLDLLGMIESDGLDTVAGGLAGWLAEASHAGSGDDVTLGLICRRDIIGAARR